MEKLIWTLLKAASYTSSGAVLYIFIFHRVLKEKDSLMPYEITSSQFDSIVRYISNYFHVLTLKEAVNSLSTNKLSTPVACITFDDGYVDNYDVAFPILQKYKVPATFFISTAYLNGGMMWNDKVIETIRLLEYGNYKLLGNKDAAGISIKDESDRLNAINTVISNLKYLGYKERLEQADKVSNHASILPNNLMMTDKQIIEMDSHGMEIGGHTHTHPILTSLSNKEAENEIAIGKHYLENLLGHELTSFAYPNGLPGKDYSTAHAELVKKLGFNCAVSTRAGYITENKNRFNLPRFTPWDRSMSKFGLRMLQNRFGLI